MNMTTTRNRTTFTHGLLCGIALTLAATTFMGHAAQSESQAAQDASAFAPQLFVTGDWRTATLWQLEEDGTLTCISRNGCDAPSARPHPREGTVPRDPRVPTGPRVPGRLPEPQDD